MYDPTAYTWYSGVFRSFFALLDKPVYLLISFLYQIFFNVANATLISGETIRAFFNRVQLILGIFILFKLAVSLVNGIINPNSITDNKTGVSKIVTRVITALIMLVLIVPLNIPSDAISNGSYESQLNNNGILFGTMYELQSRVLSQNTIAKLILGKDNSSTNFADSNDIKDAGNQLSVIILKTFINVNMKDGKEDADPTDASNRLCDSDSDIYVNAFLTSNNVTQILNSVSIDCDDYFVFTYQHIISTVVGVLFILVMVGFTLDIAIRALKLAILRLIAPIPIVSYIDPKSDGSGPFGSWVKAVTSTYIDVFIRLAIVYFILFMINEFATTGIVLNVGTGMVGAFSRVFIFLGLFFFAKEAPKFITDSLGIKGTGNLFGGLGKMFGAGALATGALSSGISNARASIAASKYNNKQSGAGKAFTFGQGLKAAGAAFTGAAGGAVTAGQGVLSAKDHQFSNAMKKVKAHNNQVMAAGLLGGTAFERAKNGVTSTLFGTDSFDALKRQESLYTKQQKDAQIELDKAKAKQGLANSMIDYGKTQAAKTGKGAMGTVAGTNIYAALDDWNAQVQSAKSKGSDTVEVSDRSGGMTTISLADAIKYQSEMEESAAADFIYREFGKGDKGDPGVQQRIANIESAGITYNTSDASSMYKDIKDSYLNGFGEIDAIENQLSATKNKLNDVQSKLPKEKANSEGTNR